MTSPNQNQSEKADCKDEDDKPSEKKEAERRGSKTFSGRGTEKHG